MLKSRNNWVSLAAPLQPPASLPTLSTSVPTPATEEGQGGPGLTVAVWLWGVTDMLGKTRPASICPSSPQVRPTGCSTPVCLYFSWLGCFSAYRVLAEFSLRSPRSSYFVVVVVVYSLSHVQLCDPMDCSPPGSSVQGISQVRMLDWVVISFSKGIFLT